VFLFKLRIGQNADTEFKFIVFASVSVLYDFFNNIFFIAVSYSPGILSVLLLAGLLSVSFLLVAFETLLLEVGGFED
jgi:hypothetical protein